MEEPVTCDDKSMQITLKHWPVGLRIAAVVDVSVLVSDMNAQSLLVQYV
jgi:hypothetical protein